MTPRNATLNKLQDRDSAAHDWYRFVLSYPPHLVRDYVERFGLGSRHRVLDPFCGTGTTLVECKKLGIASVGIEANPMAYLASRVKVDWAVDPAKLLPHAREVAHAAEKRIGEANGRGKRSLRSLSAERAKLILADSISPLPLHKTLILIDALEEMGNEKFDGHERVALAEALVEEIGNLHFGPEVGIGPPKADAPVVEAWLARIERMAEDLRGLRARRGVEAEVIHADSRAVAKLIEPRSVDAVITSPPYPNEKDYTRTTRLESVLLGLIKDKADLRAMKQGLMRSNTRNVYKGDADDSWVAGNEKIQEIAKRIEARRIELGKTSGFERLYARVTKLYFGGMARHLEELKTVLRPGAKLAYVVGDQASYLRVMIRTGELLAEIAESQGYKRIGIDLFRTRLATATRAQLREEVVVLEWPGASRRRRIAAGAAVTAK